MRVRFEFTMTELPIAYRLGVLSIIKEMIRKGSEDYFETLFVKNERNLKPFAHSSYIENIQIRNERIKGEHLFVTVSSPSYEFIIHLMNGSSKNDVYSYKNYELKLKGKRLLPGVQFSTDTVLFKTLSPLLIENNHKQPVLSHESSFGKEINYYATLLTNNFLERDLFRQIRVEHVNMKKVVAKENVHQNQDNFIYFTANHGLIQLNGHREDLKFIYHTGLGLRRSLGFGLLDFEGGDFSP